MIICLSSSMSGIAHSKNDEYVNTIISDPWSWSSQERDFLRSARADQ